MSDSPTLNLPAAHRHFAVTCFNRAWDLIDKPERTPEEDEEMLRLAMVSLWHWLEREDCTAENRSVGFWQVARVYALLGEAARARTYAQQSLEASRGEAIPPYCEAFAYEALARAEMVAGNREAVQAHLQQARLCAERLRDPETRQMLLKDLESIQ